MSRHFEQVQRLDREDGLAVTDLNDFADYIYSMSSLTNMEAVSRQQLIAALERRMVNGVLFVPKEYGMFICR